MATLVELIKKNDPKLKSAFSGDFQTADGWRDFLKEQFDWAGDRPVTNMLNSGMTRQPQAFQALYIACWIHSPVEKGTYMIRLNSAQREKVKAGYKMLKGQGRPSSHLHAVGRSARSGWAFLKGYDELLVQMEGGGKKTAGFEPNLLLKCEGHSVYHPMHYLSWVVKLVTGKGKTANPELNSLAKSGDVDGMRERGAENYSKNYEKVLLVLGLQKKIWFYRLGKPTKTIRDLAVAMYKWLTDQKEEPRLQELGRQNGIETDDLANLGGLTDPKKLADILEKVLLKGVAELPDTDRLKRAVDNATDDFDDILALLRKDQDESNRFFAEVKMMPADLDETLVEFKKELGAAG
jgi:hypothetical protein